MKRHLPLVATSVIFVALFGIAAFSYEGFFSARVVVNLFADNAFLGIAAIGMTLVIFSGGIDLSVGAVIGFTSIFTATLVAGRGVHPAVAWTAALARDDGPTLRRFLDHFNSTFVGLTGTPEQLEAAQRAAGVPIAQADPADDEGGYLVGHATQILAFTPDRLAHVVYPSGIRQADWDHDLPQLFDVGDWKLAT